MQENKKSNRFQFPYLNRDFDELQCELCYPAHVGSVMFQSLIGILMNCNPMEIEKLIRSWRVSIPNRDFDELQSINL